MPRLIMIPPRFADRRIWADLPACLPGEPEIVFCEQCSPASGSAAFPGVRALIAAQPAAVDAVIAAGDGARMAVGAALDGLVSGVVLLQPALDGIPEELGPADYSGLEERVALFAPLLTAVHEADPVKWRALVEEVVDRAIGARLAPDDAVLIRDVTADHASEIQDKLQRAVAAQARGEQQEPPAPGQRWIDRIRELSVPLSVVSTRSGFRAAETLAARAQRGQAFLARGSVGLPWLEDRLAVIDVITAMTA
jgi:hypothetical protein